MCYPGNFTTVWSNVQVQCISLPTVYQSQEDTHYRPKVEVVRHERQKIPKLDKSYEEARKTYSNAWLARRKVAGILNKF